MKSEKLKNLRRLQRKKRVRAKIKGVAQKPRVSVFRSNKHIFVQIIDDSKGVTLLSASDSELKLKKIANNKEAFFKVGQILAKKALEKDIKKVVFDRGGYKYHGRVAELARGLREGGIEL